MRVLTVALSLIVERERDILAVKPVLYWSVEALLEMEGQRFTAKVLPFYGKIAVISNTSDGAWPVTRRLHELLSEPAS